MTTPERPCCLRSIPGLVRGATGDGDVFPARSGDGCETCAEAGRRSPPEPRHRAGRSRSPALRSSVNGKEGQTHVDLAAEQKRHSFGPLTGTFARAPRPDPGAASPPRRRATVGPDRRSCRKAGAPLSTATRSICAALMVSSALAAWAMVAPPPRESAAKARKYVGCSVNEACLLVLVVKDERCIDCQAQRPLPQRLQHRHPHVAAY